MFVKRIKVENCLQILTCLFFLLLVIHFYSTPKILMVGYPDKMVYLYNGPFIFDNLDIIGNKNINKIVEFDNYDLLIFNIRPEVIIKYGFDKKLKNYSGKIILISNSESDKYSVSKISSKSSVYIYDHFPTIEDLDYYLK